MTYIPAICQLLQKKQETFSRYEEATRAMLSCHTDALEEQVDLRQQLIGEIDSLDQEIGALLAQCGPNAPLVGQALRNACPRDSLPEELRPLYDSARPIVAIIHRVGRMEPQVRERMEDERDSLLEKIKDHNKSPNVQAARLYGSLTPTSTGEYLGGGLGKA